MKLAGIVYVAFALIPAPALFAQFDTGTILGTVTDSSGAVVPSAKVRVENQGTAAAVTLDTDSLGNYLAASLPIGTYRVSASAAGFKREVREDVALRVSERLRIDLALKPGAVDESVVVSGEAPLVETASTTLGGVVNTQQISSLPLNGRNVTSLLNLIPGVVLQTGAVNQSVNGASLFRGDGGLHFLMDGADASRVDFEELNNNYGNSKGRIARASVDSVAEFRVYTNSFSAEYGQALGGVVNLITKSGTNEFHGSAFEYLRNEKLDSRNYFNTGTKPPFRLNQFGGSLGGPVVRGSLFFFANYEGVRQRDGITQNTFVPTQAFRETLDPVLRPVIDMLPLPNGAINGNTGNYRRNVSNPLTEDSGAVKIDYNISSNDRLNFRFSIDKSLTRTFFGVATGQAQTANGTVPNGKITYTRTFSPRVLNEAGFGINRIHIDPRAAETEEILNFPIVSIGGLPDIGPRLFDLKVANNSYSWLDLLTFVTGRHQLKFGGQIIRNQDNKELRFQRTVKFNSLDEFAANSPFSVGTLGQPRAGMRNTYTHLFAQDDMQLSRALTINAGLRYQYDTAPTESHGRVANFNPDTGALDPVGSPLLNAPKNNFAPRLGIAYSPFGSRKTVFRAGFGVFFANLNAATAQNVPNNVSQQASNITRVQKPDLVGFPFPEITSFASVTSLTALQKDWKTANTQQWNFNIQQALGQNAMLQVAYIGNHGIHITGNQNLNRLLPGGAGIRPYPAFGDITYNRTDLTSSYNALQVSFRRRFHAGFTFNANYTWSHALDDGGVLFGTAAQDDTNPHSAYASADYDVRHQLEFDYTYEIPTAPAVPRWLAGGWQINGTTIMRGGHPVDIICLCDPVGVGVGVARPNRVAGISIRPGNYDIPSNQLNFDAFTDPTPGYWGNLGRNVARGPAAFNWDVSLFKNFRLSEHRSVQFRAEAFNLFNTPQFDNAWGIWPFPGLFGVSLNTITTASGFGTNRQIQFALRFDF